MTIAFFDLDKTVISKNSGGLWIRSEVRLGHLSRLQALRGAGWLLRYHLGFAEISKALRIAIASLEGVPETEIRARTQVWFEREVRDLVRPGATAAIEQHRADGDRLCLLTSSSNYLSEPFCSHLGLDHALCNRFEVDAEGRFTGEPIEPLCFGAGKVVLAEAYARSLGVALTDCAFYSDSVSDLPMLEAVGRPVLVDPDPRLRRIGRKRGWPVKEWGEPASTRSADRAV